MSIFAASRRLPRPKPPPPPGGGSPGQGGERSAGRLERFRKHVQAASIARPELFERSPTRQRLRLHDTRATFVTIGLANGRTETWIADRTGHKSSIMINRYRRAARNIADLDLGDLSPLDTAVPELAPFLLAMAVPPSDCQGIVSTVLPVASAVSDFGFFSRVGHEGLEPSANGLRDRKGGADELETARKRPDLRQVGGLSGALETGTDNLRTIRGTGEARTNCSGAGGESGDPPTIGQLAGELVALAQAGDLEGARTVHASLGRLLAAERRGDGAK